MSEIIELKINGETIKSFQSFDEAEDYLFFNNLESFNVLEENFESKNYLIKIQNQKY
jgi:hypothetical protein